jgi:hypothetical protein
MDNRTKIDQIHDLMPSHFNTRNNPNWKAVVEALGGSDQAVFDLMNEVKKQFFLKTAYRPYLDNLAANDGISRPLGVGMDDATFKKYVPILAYTPKQVKLIIDQLLNIFFEKETTTAFIVSGQPQTYLLQDGWELEYKVDGLYDELIKFTTSDFTNISAATAEEVVAAINRQAQHSFAENYYDNVNKNFYVKIFSNTIGSKGSLQIVGGRANIALQFNGFNTISGNGVNTQWTITKVGDQTTYQYVAGASPVLSSVQAGDILISLLPGNTGSFPINKVDLGNNSFTVTDLFGTPGTYTQTDATQTKFFTPNKYVVYTQDSRAVTWEVKPGEAIVEMPATPPVVKRSLAGSMHINGAVSAMTAFNSSTSLTVADASSFPMAGNFWLQPVDEIQTRYFTPTEDTLASNKFNGRLQGTPVKYSYTSRLVLQTTGDTVTGGNQITNLGSVAGLAVGMNVFMPGVPSYARIASIVGNAVTLTFPVTQGGTNLVVQFAGNTLYGITPDLPPVATLDQQVLTSLVRSGGVVTATTAGTHNYQVGQPVSIFGSSGIVSQTSTGTVTNGLNLITSVSPTNTIAAGELIVGANIPTGTQVQSVSGNTVTMTLSATGSATETITFNENLNGSFIITSVTSNTFTFDAVGIDGTATIPGNSMVENIGLSDTASLVIITNALPSTFTRLTGTYVWDLAAPFVLSSNTASTTQAIHAGQIVPLLSLTQNTIPSGGGFVIFDYGLETQEGPIRYLYTPNDSSIVLDPSYIFQFNHASGSAVTAINNKGPHIMSGLGTEFPPYITNPSSVRLTLENLIQSVASAGIFVNFLVRYPEQLYGTIPVYQITS